jgi:pyruvate/2-oxoglutarate dehydrogenase complex dihydrolipoamide dehydrogenase (E3) component
MPAYDFDLGILGGGAAGLTVAAGAARLGVRTLLVEKAPHLGGDCLHFGCVPSKTLIKTARVRHLMATAGRYGLPGVDLPPVDFRKVSARIRQVIAAIQPHDSPERFCSLGAQVEFGAPAFADEHVVELDGKRVSAARWVVATGSSAAIPDLPGLADAPYLTNKEIFFLDELPASLLILGGGPIAVEMAQSFARLGARVTVLQRSPQILSREDPDLAGLIQARLEAEGVAFHLGARLVAVRRAGDQAEVVFRDAAGQERSVRADKLLVALGRRANLDGLGLERAGVEHSARGIPVDARMRTSRKHVFAAGDVTGQHQFTHAAGYEGGIVVANAVFRLPRKADYAWLPHCTYTDPELASVGLNEKAAQRAGVEYRVWTEEFRANDRSLAEGYDFGVLKLLVDRKENPLGVQICGPHAGDLLAEWVAVLAGKVRLSTLAGAVHPYPTLAEISKRVAGDMLAPKIFSDTVRKGLGFIFDYKGRACTPDR